MIDVHIRWLVRRDLDDVLRLEQHSPECWTRDDITRFKLPRQNSAMVAEFNSLVVGFMLYSLEPGVIRLAHLAVHPLYQHCGVGRQMLEYLQNKLRSGRRTRITCDVPDWNLIGHVFLRACGWRAERVLRHSEGDEYRFTWSAPAGPKVRIAGGECEGI